MKYTVKSEVFQKFVIYYTSFFYLEFSQCTAFAFDTALSFLTQHLPVFSQCYYFLRTVCSDWSIRSVQPIRSTIDPKSNSPCRSLLSHLLLLH